MTFTSASTVSERDAKHIRNILTLAHVQLNESFEWLETAFENFPSYSDLINALPAEDSIYTTQSRIYLALARVYSIHFNVIYDTQITVDNDLNEDDDEIEEDAQIIDLDGLGNDALVKAYEHLYEMMAYLEPVVDSIPSNIKMQLKAMPTLPSVLKYFTGHWWISGSLWSDGTYFFEFLVYLYRLKIMIEIELK